MRRLDVSALARARSSAWALVLANLLPAFGVLFLGWDLGVVLLLFWAENGVIGLWSMVRLTVRARWGALVGVPFFVFHYGVFMVGHLLFLSVLVLGLDVLKVGPAGLIDGHERVFLLALAALFLSHGVSFWQHFVIGGERYGDSAMSEMAAPYVRVMILHVVIMGSAFPVLALGEPMWALVLLVGIKTGVDLMAHAAAHQRRRMAAAEKSGEETEANGPLRSDA